MMTIVVINKMTIDDLATDLNCRKCNGEFVKWLVWKTEIVQIKEGKCVQKRNSERTMLSGLLCKTEEEGQNKNIISVKNVQPFILQVNVKYQKV